MLKSVFLTLRLRFQLRRSLGPLLSRYDDRLLLDVGLTRHQAERLLRSAADQTAAPEGGCLAPAAA
jgi:uncharacterized protein YjiS (DUF1127 family)